MNKVMKTMVSMATMMGIGYGAWRMYKMKNPNAMNDLKNATKMTLRKTADFLEDASSEM